MPRFDFYEKHCEKYYSWFLKNEQFFTDHPARIKALDIFKKLSTVLTYAVYVYILAMLIISKDIRIIKAVIVPAAIFFITTAVRSGINAPRPYEKYPMKSILHKSTKGNSCPSRHTACAFAIAFACLFYSLPMGMAMLILAVLIAVLRLIMGVHFPLDVLFGAVLAAVISLIGFVLIP